MKIWKLQETVRKLSLEKRWLDGEDTLPELVSHAHTELSEVIEALRQGGSRHPLELSGEDQGELGDELADVLISTLLMFQFCELDAEFFIKRKIEVLGNREPRGYFNKRGRNEEGTT